jgi:hypothetical protein
MDVRRGLITLVLLGGLVWAWFNSPLTKRFRGGTTAVRRPVVQAPAPLQIEGAQTSVAQPATGSPSSSSPSSPAAPLTREELTQWRQRHESAWRRDPFLTAQEEQALLAPKAAPVTPKQAPAPLPSYTLKAVLISDGEKVATLNSSVVSEGEQIGEERVLEIRPDRVVLERAGQRRTISLLGGTTPIAETDSRKVVGTR